MIVALHANDRAQLRQLRATEDAALDRWRRATAAYQRVVAHKAATAVRAQRRLQAARRPLSSRSSRCLERAYESSDAATLARYASRVGGIRSYLETVRAAQAAMHEAIAAADARLEHARQARGAAARALLALPPLPDAVVGASRQQLGTYARE